MEDGPVSWFRWCGFGGGPGGIGDKVGGKDDGGGEAQYGGGESDKLKVGIALLLLAYVCLLAVVGGGDGGGRGSGGGEIHCEGQHILMPTQMRTMSKPPNDNTEY